MTMMDVDARKQTRRWTHSADKKLGLPTASVSDQMKSFAKQERKPNCPQKCVQMEFHAKCPCPRRTESDLIDRITRIFIPLL